MMPLGLGFGGPWDMAIVAGVVLLLFGGSKLAGWGKGLGEGIREFKKHSSLDEPAEPTAPAEAPASSKPDEKTV